MSTNEMNPMSVLDESPATLANIPTKSLAEFQAEAFTAPVNRLTAALQRANKADTVLHIGRQIKSEDVAGKVLTIVRVGFGAAPATNMDGTPVWQTDENGAVVFDKDGQTIQAMSRFAVCHFKEAPGWWYNGGKMLQGIIETLATECGDDVRDNMLPNVNQALAEIGGLKVYMDWKDSSKNRGQKYMNIIPA